MVRLGIVYLPKWVVIHNPGLFLLYWFLVLFTWLVFLWRFVELEQYAIQSPVKGVATMLPFASGLSATEASAAMDADRSKPFCSQPSAFGYTFHDGGQSFNYTDIHCTHLCHEASGMDKACMNEAEMSMDSPSGTFIPTFFSDLMMHNLHDVADPSYYYVPGIESMKLTFSHNYYAVRPDDLIAGPRETLVGSSDGAATSGAPVTTVVMNHSGSILRRFEPGELISLTVAEVLMAGKAEEFGDDDSRLLLDGRYYNFEERVMREESANGPQGPPLRLTGADITIKISYTNKGYCRMEKDSPRLWVPNTPNSQVACVTVRAKRGWTQKDRNAVFNEDGAFWTRTYHGLKISFESSGVFSSFDSFALFESLTILFIWLQVPSLIIYVMAAFMLGTLSKVYSSVMHQEGGLIGTTAGIAARLLNYSSTYNDLRDDQGVTKQRMLRRFNYILAHEEDLDENEREKFVDFVYKSILSTGGMDAKTSHCDMLSFCTACASGEPLSFEILQAFFNRKKRVGLVERVFQDRSISAIQSVTESQLDITDSGDAESLKDAAAPFGGPASQSGSGSRLGEIFAENTRMQERCAEVTESLKETLKVASSVTEEDATTRLEIYRDEVQKIGKSTKMSAQTLADGSIYEGEWVGPVRHGRGVLKLPDGSSYSGQFEHGVVHGFAAYTLPTGAKYEGEWRLGKQDGEGREITAEGAIYQGQYKDGKKEGHARISYPDGSSFEGQVSDGKLHGKGKYVWSNGHCYEGDWQDDMMHGDGVYTWPTGVKFVGQYQNNLKHGTGVVHFPDGRTVEGTYEAGTRQSTSG